MTTKQCKEMGYEDDFTTPQEKQLGRIMHDDHRSDFYIVRRRSQIAHKSLTNRSQSREYLCALG